MPLVAVQGEYLFLRKLEYNVVEHCNFSCAECSHFSPYMSPAFSEIDEFRRDVLALTPVLRIKRFRFVGGEPFLHKKLVEFIDVVRKSGLCEEIEICSNGSLLHKVGDDVFSRIDSLSVSWYPDERCDKEKIDIAKAKSSEFGFRLKVEKIGTFRVMEPAVPIADQTLVKRIYQSCEIAHTWGCQTFYKGSFYLCSRPLFLNSYLAGLGVQDRDYRQEDGLPIHQAGLKKRLETYLQRTEPLASCARCYGTVGRIQPWRGLSPNERRHPVAKSITEDLTQISRVRLHVLIVVNAVSAWMARAIPRPRVVELLARAKAVLSNS